tara:strand:+ start:3981 stop:4703 length:723 start_codon:yes stop_codon:yes gene_type:complete
MNEWKPDRKLKEWAIKHFAEMNVGGIWMPDSSGLTFIKVDKSTWSLKSKIESPEAEENLMRMRGLMADVGFVLLEDAVMVVPEPTNEEEARMLEIHMKRDVAQNWAASDGTLLKDMDLENVWPEFVEDKEIILDNGDTTTVQIWVYRPLNPNTDEYLSIDPDDYHLLMGDKYFMRFRTPDYEYHALSREEMIEHIDTQKGVHVSSTGVGSKYIEGGEEEVKIPPWMWGTYCMFTDRSEEE